MNDNCVFYTFRNLLILPFLLIPLFTIVGCDESNNNSGNDPLRNVDPAMMLGGTVTVFDEDSSAYSHPAPGLSEEGVEKHARGLRAFNTVFEPSPSAVNEGLGPIFNNSSCVGCHLNNGRGTPEATFESMLFRVSVTGFSDVGGPLDAPGYGGQLQNRAIPGTTPEANVLISYEEVPGAYGDGTPYSLRMPTYTIDSPYIPLPEGFLKSPRVAPAVFGLGLLEAIPRDDILAIADPLDGDGDGISGRPNVVWNADTEQYDLGRFGWKAESPTLLQQTAGAYNQDMGVTNPLFPVESSSGQPQDDGLLDDPEIDEQTLNDTVFFVQTLAVPGRRDFDEQSLRGQTLFNEAKCSSCHVTEHLTGIHLFPDEKVLNNQVIIPYTDLLLHDMGEGLSDGRPTFTAEGSEWRTSPLWGIGLVDDVNDHTTFLHDGRARNLQEAILWHGGEAEGAKEFFRTLSTADRDALISFLNNL